MQNLISITTILFHFSLASGCIDSFSFDNGFQRMTEILNERILHQNATFIEVETLLIEQPLDHFNASVNHPWRMRYFRRLDLWKPKGPIFLFIGGEGKAGGSWLSKGQVVDMARETNGALFASEHRYYGESMPFKSLDPEKLRYLSSRQALADIDALLTHIKSESKFESSKVVLVGGSYAGNLAAWMKVLYPDKIDAALSSSAPVLAKLDFYEYVETVGNVLKKYGTIGCYEFIEAQFNKYTEAFKTQKGIEDLKETENICKYSDMNNSDNQQAFIYTRLGKFMSLAQYGTVSEIKAHCESIMNNHKGMKSEDQSNVQCQNVNFQEYVNKIKCSDFYYQWFYQKCSEFSYFKSTSSDRHPFTKNIKVDTLYKMCAIVFGRFNHDIISQAVDFTNKLYGGLTPKLEKVYFVNGELDPWHRLGVLKDLSNDVPSLLIPEASHCRDLLPSKPGDPPALTEAKRKIRQTILKWIQ